MSIEVSETVEIKLTPEEVLEVCTTMALAKIGEIDGPDFGEWSSNLKFVMENGKFLYALVKVTRRK